MKQKNIMNILSQQIKDRLNKVGGQIQ
jgi:hypothetical protein